jgi:hypothetical protein
MSIAATGDRLYSSPTTASVTTPTLEGCMKTALHFLVGVALASALLVAGCASPPEAEKKAAEDAVRAAQSAGADRYAADDYAATQAALKEAEGHVGAKKYSEAKTAYVKVKELADQAASKVEAGKAAVKAEVDRAVADVEKRWQEADARVKAVGQRLKTEQTKVWEEATRSTGEALESVKAAAASDPLGAREKVAALGTEVEKLENEARSWVEAAAKEPPGPAARKRK